MRERYPPGSLTEKQEAENVLLSWRAETLVGKAREAVILDNSVRPHAPIV